ncbi:uncharacterized protein SAPINGB_P001469 [Magnusiomyces paraingens]|uniref:HTH CENPB-type domain-containing protein n=1 Tax=Magnusiomyces paraingens TaxID=2606893 RepID=A0A5E8B805_9ASCO|nr:uncharacterized protein SAPINGB_P001469 [Saprochaete ingens]VVT46952.1 unnamed protein product [Saprochaete ingens]
MSDPCLSNSSDQSSTALPHPSSAIFQLPLPSHLNKYSNNNSNGTTTTTQQLPPLPNFNTGTQNSSSTSSNSHSHYLPPPQLAQNYPKYPAIPSSAISDIPTPSGSTLPHNTTTAPTVATRQNSTLPLPQISYTNSAPPTSNTRDSEIAYSAHPKPSDDPQVDDTTEDKEQRITSALEEFKNGTNSIRNLSNKYNVPRSTLRDRIKRAHLANNNKSGEERRISILKSRSKNIIDRQTRDFKQRERDALIQEALDYYHSSELEGTKQGIRALSAKFGIPRSTLRGRLQGSTSNRSANRVQKGQKLSLEEEDTLVQWVKALCHSGEEVTASRIRNMANLLQQYRPSSDDNMFLTGDSDPESFADGTGPKVYRKAVDPLLEKKHQVCLGWVRGFLGRHPALIDANGTILNVDDVKNFTKDSFRDWFQLVCEKITLRHIPPENIFIAGASSFFVSNLIVDNQRQVTPADLAPLYLLPSAPQSEPFASLECFSFNCDILNPFIVLNGDSDLKIPDDLAAQWSFNYSSSLFLPYEERRQQQDHNNNDIQHIRVEKELLYKWLTQWFDVTSKKHANPEYPRVLISDSDWADLDPNFNNYCKNNGIDFLGIPVNKFHELFPFTAGIFGKVKKNFCSKVESMMKTTTTGGQESDDGKQLIIGDNLFLCFHDARKQAMSNSTLSKALKQSGLWPLDSNLVINRIWNTSEISSIGTTTDSNSLPYGPALLSALETSCPITKSSSTSTRKESSDESPDASPPGDTYLQSILNDYRKSPEPSSVPTSSTPNHPTSSIFRIINPLSPEPEKHKLDEPQDNNNAKRFKTSTLHNLLLRDDANISEPSTDVRTQPLHTEFSRQDILPIPSALQNSLPSESEMRSNNGGILQLPSLPVALNNALPNANSNVVSVTQKQLILDPNTTNNSPLSSVPSHTPPLSASPMGRWRSPNDATSKSTSQTSSPLGYGPPPLTQNLSLSSSTLNLPLQASGAYTNEHEYPSLNQAKHASTAQQPTQYIPPGGPATPALAPNHTSHQALPSLFDLNLIPQTFSKTYQH